MTVYVKTLGQGNALLLLHGWGFNHSIWETVVPALASHFRLFLVDLPGFGASSFMEWLAFKEELLSYLPATFAVAGWSMGGLYALRLAYECPQVTHLINVASSPCFIKQPNWPGIDKTAFKEFFYRLEHHPQQTLSEFISAQLQGQSFNCSGTPPTKQALQYGLEVLAQWDLRAQLGQLSIPSCYIFGRLDAITPPATYNAMQRHHPQVRSVLFNRSAHVPFLSEQEQFIQQLMSFL